MSKAIFTILFSLFTSYYIYGQNAAWTSTADENLKTLQTITNNDFMLPPVIRLGSDDKLNISFDILGNDMQWLSYKITHCDIDWKNSTLSETEYLTGFNNNQIENPKPSFNTFVSYYHYSLSLPNEDVNFKISGNYKAEIYNDSNPDNILATICFYVVDNMVNITSTMSTNTDIDFNKNHQQLDISLNWKDNIIKSPSTDLKLVVKQNNRFDNQSIVKTPTTISSNSANYTHKKELIFEAGNNYRRAEFISNKYAGMNVDKIIEINNVYNCILKDDIIRSNMSYEYDQDQNGRYVVSSSENDDNDIESDYYLVHFFLKKPVPYRDGEVFIIGDLTNNSFNKDSRMDYDESTGGYYKSLLLKQGHYNYQYLFSKDGLRGTTSTTEGNYYEANNEYLILVYYRTYGDRYDKLIGFNLLR